MSSPGSASHFPFFLLSRRFILKGFLPEGRDLSDKETKLLLAAGDKDGDGKIGVDGRCPSEEFKLGTGKAD